MSECVKGSLQERSGRDLSGDEGTGWAINTQWQGGVSESLLRDDFSIPSFFDSSFFILLLLLFLSSPPIACHRLELLTARNL